MHTSWQEKDKRVLEMILGNEECTHEWLNPSLEMPSRRRDAHTSLSFSLQRKREDTEACERPGSEWTSSLGFDQHEGFEAPYLFLYFMQCMVHLVIIKTKSDSLPDPVLHKCRNGPVRKKKKKNYWLPLMCQSIVIVYT